MTTTRPVTWASLEAELDALRASLPQLRAQHPDDDACMAAFTGLIEPIAERANVDDDWGHAVHVRRVDMLIELGLVPEEHRQH